MHVRTKFKVVEISPATRDGVVATVRLEAARSNSPENDRFFRWASSGQITLGMVNMEAVENFQLGKAYYVDFSDAGD